MTDTPLKLEWHTEKRKVSDLIAWEHNPRKITETQVAQLKQSLEKFNLVELPAINLDNKIVAGHQRLKVMALLGRGEEEIEVRVPNRMLTADEFKEYNVRSNKNVGMWDFDILANVFNSNELVEWGFDFSELGIDPESGKEAIDKDNLSNALDTYLSSDIKQVVLYFKGEDFQNVINRLDKVMEEEGVKDHSEAFMRMLEHYETNSS